MTASLASPKVGRRPAGSRPPPDRPAADRIDAERSAREASRAGVVSDSHVKQPAHSRPKDGVASLAYARKILKHQSDVIHRPLWRCGAGRRLLFPFPSHAGGERSAESRTISSLDLVAAPRAV